MWQFGVAQGQMVAAKTAQEGDGSDEGAEQIVAGAAVLPTDRKDSVCH